MLNSLQVYLLGFDVVQAHTKPYYLPDIGLRIKLLMRVLLGILEHGLKVDLVFLGNLLLDETAENTHHLVSLSS
jgi:hypothetical protein